MIKLVFVQAKINPVFLKRPVFLIYRDKQSVAASYRNPESLYHAGMACRVYHKTAHVVGYAARTVPLACLLNIRSLVNSFSFPRSGVGMPIAPRQRCVTKERRRMRSHFNALWVRRSVGTMYFPFLIPCC
jgi:hypothetical protein